MYPKTGTGDATDERRVFRSKAVSWSVGGISGFLALMMGAAALSPDNNTGSLVFAILTCLIATWFAVWAYRCGILVEDSGIRVVNPVSTVRMKWSEIARFEFRPYGSCAIKCVDGRSVSIVGIQQSAWAARRGQTDTQAAKQIAELNGLLEANRNDADER